MNIMNMPRFTAETSLYTSAGRYWSMPTSLQSEGTTIVPAQVFCGPISTECGPCVPLGPTIFSRGRQFCTYKTCQPTFSGGCRCRVFFKGFLPCYPTYDPPVATE